MKEITPRNRPRLRKFYKGGFVVISLITLLSVVALVVAVPMNAFLGEIPAEILGRAVPLGQPVPIPLPAGAAHCPDSASLMAALSDASIDTIYLDEIVYELSDTVSIGRDLTLYGPDGVGPGGEDRVALIKPAASCRHFYITSVMISLTFDGVVLDGNGTVTSGPNPNGGIEVTNSGIGSYVISGAVITGCYAPRGGGILTKDRAHELALNDCFITDNASGEGGGVFSSGTLTMSGGEVSGNKAASGGGVYIGSHGAFALAGGAILGNTSDFDGGGVYALGAFEIVAGLISGNTAGANGGGIAVSSSPSYPANLGQVIIRAGAVFSDNQASALYDRAPAEDALYEAQIGTGGLGVTWTSPLVQGYNNYDISYVGSTVTLHIYKFWGDLKTYTLTYDANGGSGVPGPQTAYPGMTIAISPIVPIRTDYFFLGWAPDSAAPAAEYLYGDAITMDSDKILFAVWGQAAIHVIHEDGVSGSILYQDTFAVSPGVYGPYSAMVFSGYTTGVLAPGSAPPIGTIGSGQTLTITYLYTTIFAVTYDPNGGNGSSFTEYADSSNQIAIAANPFIRDGYIFSEWNTEPDGLGASYTVSQIDLLTEDLYLYAQWVSDVTGYTVTYDPNGGTGDRIVVSVADGQVYLIENNQFTRPYWSFSEWNTEPDGRGVSYRPGDQITISDNLYLFAIWSRPL
ncbi:MAG: InlB B-repeat-containing protein [Dehalococcoidia bacterium]|nr:InlB B-repeat-containing protein [Dehalococcoidia bacterium]